MAKNRLYKSAKSPSQRPWTPGDPEQWTLEERVQELADFLPLISDEAIEELDQTYLIGLRVPVDGQLILGPLPVVGIAARFVMLGYRYGWVSPRADWCKWHVAPAGRFYLDHVAQISGASIDDLVYLMTTLIRCERFCEGTLTNAFRQGHITAICRRAAVIADELRRGVRHRATRFDDIWRWTRIGMGDCGASKR